jgi:hypothetical protein
MAPRFVAASLAVLFLVAGCASAPHFEDPFARAQIDWRPALVLDAGDAGRILGARSRLERVTSYLEDGTRTFQATFVDDALAPVAGRRGALGYMYEEYQTSEAARSYLDTTLKENRLSPLAAVRIDGTELHYFTGGDVVRMAEAARRTAATASLLDGAPVCARLGGHFRSGGHKSMTDDRAVHRERTERYK